MYLSNILSIKSLFTLITIGSSSMRQLRLLFSALAHSAFFFRFFFNLPSIITRSNLMSLYSITSSTSRTPLVSFMRFDIYAPLFSVELVLESSNSVFFTPTITLFVAFVVPLRAAIPALGAFLINVFAAAFAPPP